MTYSDRLQQVLNYSKMSARAFAGKCGIKQQTFDRQSKGQSEISISTLSAILTTFPEVSSDWLLLGNGEMLRDANKEAERINRLVDTIATLQEVIDSKNATIAALTERIKNLE